MTLPRLSGIALLTLGVVATHLATHLTRTEFYLTQLTMSAYFLLVVLGLCVLMGYAGQISLGHAGFFAIGGYVSAFLTTFNLASRQGTAPIAALGKLGLLMTRADLYGAQMLHVKPWAAGLVGILCAVGVAFFIARPVLALKGHYLAMATLGFGIIVYQLVLGSSIFGAADGISDVPPFRFLAGFEIGGRAAVRVFNFYFAWGLVVLGIWALLNLVDSRVGRALRAIHGAEDAAGAMGIDTARAKLKTFVLSAAYAAVAGVFLTHYNGGIGPSEASALKSVRYVAIVAVGGMANLWGALVMGTALNFFSLRGSFGSYDDAVFGAILIVIMLFAPEGLVTRRFLTLRRRRFGRRGEADDGPP